MKKFLFAVLIVAVVAVMGVVVWQKDNITAVYDGLKESDTDIQLEIADSKKNVEKELEQYNVEGLRDFTFEEEEAIRKGQITVDDAIQKIVNESSASSGNKSTENKGSESGDIISEYTLKLYSLKATYLGQIGNLIDEAKADYKNGLGASALMSKYLGKAGSLEGEADAKVEDLLSELKTELEAIGANTSIVDTMRSSYENEKTLKKSYYLSLFNKKK